MIATGLLLATSEAEKYAPNPFFWTKDGHFWLDRRTRPDLPPNCLQPDRRTRSIPVIPTKAKVAAILSLVIWATMFTMGRLIAYWD
jgi:hypothetical protein